MEEIKQSICYIHIYIQYIYIYVHTYTYCRYSIYDNIYIFIPTKTRDSRSQLVSVGVLKLEDFAAARHFRFGSASVPPPDLDWFRSGGGGLWGCEKSMFFFLKKHRKPRDFSRFFGRMGQNESYVKYECSKGNTLPQTCTHHTYISIKNRHQHFPTQLKAFNYDRSCVKA